MLPKVLCDRSLGTRGSAITTESKGFQGRHTEHRQIHLPPRLHLPRMHGGNMPRACRTNTTQGEPMCTCTHTPARKQSECQSAIMKNQPLSFIKYLRRGALTDLGQILGYGMHKRWPPGVGIWHSRSHLRAQHHGPVTGSWP